MKGYKALDKDMRAVQGNGMQFEIGKLYSVDGEVIPCKNGFHFCDKIEDLICYYDLAESRIFEVEADGNIKQEEVKYVAQSIRLVREFSKQEIKDYFKDNLESLVKESNCVIKKVIVEHGCGLDKLINNENWLVRRAVAKQGYRLDKLINDENEYVREVVAEQGYGLEILINDKNGYVREAVAKQGYGLDILVNDKNECVRKTALNML